MFFTTLVFLPVLAGLVAGVFTADRRLPWMLGGVCVLLGIAGAVVAAFDPDGRAATIAFSLGASLVCAALVWAGYALGRASRRVGRLA
jgi:quinol-cytochrome oxidoreductase complex cytochrome b subunit